jgi:hypothetical protein
LIVLYFLFLMGPLADLLFCEIAHFLVDICLKFIDQLSEYVFPHIILGSHGLWSIFMDHVRALRGIILFNGYMIFISLIMTIGL